MSGVTVDIWWLSLSGGADVAAKYAPLLSPHELERARRLRFDNLRDEFIIGHGALRLILAEYAGMPAERLELTQGRHGKPALRGDGIHYYNMSHSGALLVCAVTTACDLGVDVELIRPVRDADAIANRFFSPAEAALLAAFPPEERDAAFFRCWTRKEAFLKATGDGLTRSLSSFEVAFEGEHARFVRIDDDDPARWTLHAFEPETGYTAALAIPARLAAVNLWEFSIYDERGLPRQA